MDLSDMVTAYYDNPPRTLDLYQKKILGHFLQTLQCKNGEYANAVAVKKVWLLCENSWVQLRVSAPSLSEELLLTDPALLCSYTKALGVTFRKPASPANWGLHRAQQSTPHTHCTGGGTGERKQQEPVLSAWWEKCRTWA